MFVIHNKQRPESVLKKQSNAIMQSGKQWPWASASLVTYPPTIIPPTSAQRVYREGKNVTIWLVYTSTILPTTLDDPPHWLRFAGYYGFP